MLTKFDKDIGAKVLNVSEKYSISSQLGMLQTALKEGERPEYVDMSFGLSSVIYGNDDRGSVVWVRVVTPGFQAMVTDAESDAVTPAGFVGWTVRYAH